MKRTALVVEGGAMRGVFSCGILDSFIEAQFRPFDLCIGVSAGANNLSGYMSGMHQRNYRIYTDYSLRPEFISWKKFLLGGHLLDLDWLWEITIREMPLDYSAVAAQSAEYVVGATRVDTGAVDFLSPSPSTDLAQLLKASSAVPLLYRNQVELNGSTYIDGGIGDPIPVREAVRRGATEILVLRSRPRSFTMSTNQKHRMTRLALRKYPAAVRVIQDRPEVYNSTIAYIRNPPEGVTITEINPPEEFSVERLTTDYSALRFEYERGHAVGQKLTQEYPPISARYIT